MFEGILMTTSTVPLFSDAKLRSISAENMSGQKNKGALTTLWIIKIPISF